MESRSTDTKRDYSVHPPPPFVRHAENMPNEEKHATQALGWTNRVQRSKQNPED